MYSTSSSECECDEYCTCGAGVYGNQGSYGRTPFYSSMGQPLVYYAQMPPLSKRQQSRESRNEKKNCFSKAFKWYTQEHVPYQSISPNKTEINAFAAWLDSKYDEFLRDSQLGSVYHLKVKHTSIIEADRIIPNNTCCEPRPKRFRVKSPWRRKRRTGSKEAGDAIQKPNQSFHFILQPKELTRPASECCQPSEATMISTELPVRSTLKSQSYTLISHEPVDTKACDDKPDTNADQPNKDQLKASQNISCQCSEVEVEKTNAHSQYDESVAERVIASDNQITPRITHQLNNENAKPAALKKVQAEVPIVENLMICNCARTPLGPRELIQKADSHSQYEAHNLESSLSNIQSSSKMVKACPCETEEEVKVENLIQSDPIAFSDDGVQTSFHSINLEKDVALGYPLFMKIVCADKLCK